MDTEGLVIYAGTFSKILSPGIRTGYLIAPGELFGKMVVQVQTRSQFTALPGLSAADGAIVEDVHGQIWP